MTNWELFQMVAVTLLLVAVIYINKSDKKAQPH